MFFKTTPEKNGSAGAVCRSFFLWILFLLFFSTSIPALAAPKEKRNPDSGKPPIPKALKLAYCEYMPFYFNGANNKPRGILVDIWQLWSRKTKIPIEFVLSPWDMAISDVILGKTDISGLMYKTPEREAMFEFSLPLFDLSTQIYYRKSLIPSPAEPADLKNLRIGTVARDFSESFITNTLETTPSRYFATHEQLIRAALNGEVDAFIMEVPVASTYLAKHEGLDKIGHLPLPAYKKPLYAAVREGESQLIETINQGLGRINPREIARIIRSWTGEDSNLVWQPATEKITIVSSVDNMPFHFADENNQAVGMLIDMWRLWSKKTGIQVEFVTAPWAKSLEMVKTGQADIHAGCFFSVKRDEYLDYAGILKDTETHFFFHESIFGLKNLEDLTGFKIGVLDQDYAVEFITRELPDAALKIYNSHRELFEGVEKGEVRVFICDTPTALYFLQKKNLLAAFRYHPAHPLYRKPFYAAVQEGNATLLNQVNEGLEAITNEEKAAIERNWMGFARTGTQGTLVIAIERDFPPFSFLNAEGRPSGLFVDLWDAWSQKTHTPVSFKLYDRLEAIHALNDGIADILSTLPPKNRIEAWMDLAPAFYQFKWYIYRAGASTPRASSPNLYPENEMGVVSGTRAWEWASVRQPSFKLKQFQTARDMILAAASGQIKSFLALPQEVAALPGQLGVPSDFKPDPEPAVQYLVSPITRNYKPELQKKISLGFKQIANTDLVDMETRWISRPQARYFTPGRASVRLTEAEEKWLARHYRKDEKIRLGIQPDTPPFEFIDRNNALSGMVSDYLTLINQRLGISLGSRENITPLDPKAGPDNHKEFDVLPSALSFEEKTDHFRYSEPYLSFPWVIVNKRQAPLIAGLRDLYGKTVAVNRRYGIRNRILRDHPAIRIIGVDSAVEGLNAVKINKVDAYIGNLAVVGYQLKEKNDTHLKIAASTGYTDAALTFAVRSDWPQLVSMINKAIASISDQEHNRIRQKWFSVRFEHGVDKIFIRNLIFKIAAVAAVILILVFFWHIQIRKREERFRCLTEHGSDIVQAFGTDGKIIYQSPSFTTVLGYPPRSLRGRRVSDLLHPEEKQAWENIIQRLLHENNRQSIVHRIRHAKGHFLYFESIFSNLTRNRALKAIVMNGREITERLAAEREMQQARELAENASRMKTDFLASLSHEIRTPLNTILGMTDVTLNTRLDPAQTENLQSVKHSARHLLDVISDLLDVSTIESGKMKIQPSAFDLFDLMSHINSTWDFQARKKNLSFVMQIAPQTPRFVRSDPVRLRQMLTNLCSNAVKFTHHGQVTLSAAPRDALPDKPSDAPVFIEFKVQDTGIGIHPERLDSIFERFTQEQASTTREYGGTGLGLAICREMSKLLGGTIRVDSRPQKGSSFTLSLPFEIMPDMKPDTSFCDAQPVTFDTRPLNLLVVDDDPMNTKVFMAFLESSPHRVFCAKDGLEALEQLKQHPIDLVFMDIEMPKLDGLSTCRQIRSGKAGAHNKNIPVLAMTAHVLDEFKTKSTAAGMNGFIAKPIAPDRLIEAIQTYCLPGKNRVCTEKNRRSLQDMIDEKKALMSLGENRELLQTIYRIFSEQTGGQIEALKKAVRDRDSERIRITAHALKGGAARIYANTCTEKARMLEQSANDMPFEHIASLARDTIVEFDELIKILDNPNITD